MMTKTRVITVRLTEEQYRFFNDWQKKTEAEIGIDVPMGAVIRRALDSFIKSSVDGQPPALVEPEKEIAVSAPVAVSQPVTPPAAPEKRTIQARASIRMTSLEDA